MNIGIKCIQDKCADSFWRSIDVTDANYKLYFMSLYGIYHLRPLLLESFYRFNSIDIHDMASIIALPNYLCEEALEFVELQLKVEMCRDDPKWYKGIDNLGFLEVINNDVAFLCRFEEYVNVMRAVYQQYALKPGSTEQDLYQKEVFTTFQGFSLSYCERIIRANILLHPRLRPLAYYWVHRSEVASYKMKLTDDQIWSRFDKEYQMLLTSAVIGANIAKDAMDALKFNWNTYVTSVSLRQFYLSETD